MLLDQWQLHAAMFREWHLHINAPLINRAKICQHVAYIKARVPSLISEAPSVIQEPACLYQITTLYTTPNQKKLRQYGKRK